MIICTLVKIRNLISGLIITALTSSQVAFALAATSTNSPLTPPITGPISTPTASPSATPNPTDKFTNLSADMPFPGQAVFRFNYNGSPTNYFFINASTIPDMSWDVYWRFAGGFRNPISLSNPVKWDKYSCGRTLYWQAVSITGDKSPIQQTTVTCTNPIPVGAFTNLSANLTGTQAFFNFTYSGPQVTGYHVDMSTYQDMSWDVYLAFGNNTQSPINVTNPQARWSKYACGRTLYWRVYDSYRRVSSPIQTSTIQCATPTPTPTPTPRPTPLPSLAPLTVNPNLVYVTLKKSGAVNGIVYGPGFTVTTNSTPAWSVIYTNQFLTSSDYGFTPVQGTQTTTVRTFIKANLPNSTLNLNGSPYRGTATINYYKVGFNGGYLPAATVSYVINLVD